MVRTMITKTNDQAHTKPYQTIAQPIRCVAHTLLQCLATGA